VKGLSFYILTYFQVTIMFLTGCANQVNYLCTDEALLPVMVKGKNASNDYLIVVAGGPAG